MTDAERAAFNRGYLIACCNLVSLHNEPCIASDVLREAGISAAEVKAMDLCDYDAKALREICFEAKYGPIADMPRIVSTRSASTGCGN